MNDTVEIAGTLAGKIMSVFHGTHMYRDTAIIQGIDFDDVAKTVKAKRRGSRTEITIEINNTVFIMYYRKGYLFYERESWKVENLSDIQRMLKHFQEIVQRHFILEAAAGVI